MIVRQIDSQGDWTFGKGKNNYVSQNRGVGQNIRTRLASFLGDCFFDVGAGIDWFNLLGTKQLVTLNLAISTTILNTQDVTGILELSIDLDNNRRIKIVFNAQTTYGNTNEVFQYDFA